MGKGYTVGATRLYQSHVSTAAMRPSHSLATTPRGFLFFCVSVAAAKAFIIKLRTKMRLLLIFLIFSLTSCTTTSPNSIVANVFVSGDAVVIRGTITKDAAEKFKQAIGQARISRILLDTGGGNVEASIEIAYIIHERKLDVEVVKDCFSSCANYLFTAGKNKIIGDHGIVAWHGNANHLLYKHKTGQKLLNDSEFELSTRLAKLEEEFFKTIGTNQFLCWFGKLEPFHVRNFYFLSKNDMERFGVRNVRVRSDYEASNTSHLNAWWGLENLKHLTVDWTTYKAELPKS